MTPEHTPEHDSALQIRSDLIQQLGGAATREIELPSPEAIAKILPTEGGLRSDPAKHEMHRAIGHLGGQHIALVDVVLTLDSHINTYVENAQGFLPRSLVYNRQVPSILRALIPEGSTKVRKQLNRVWGAYIEEQYGMSSVDGSANGFVKGKQKQSPAGRTEPASRRPKPKSQAKQRKVEARRKTQNSPSYQASRRAYNLQHKDDSSSS